jgi:alkanesulfonate monooxygenase
MSESSTSGQEQSRRSPEFFGVLQGNLYSEIEPTDSALVAAHVRHYARLHEQAAFDGILIGTNAEGEDSIILATFAAQHTERLRFLIAHRPAPISPTLAARQLASFDQLSGGRTHVHVITSRDGESLREGDPLTKDQRYARTAEHIRFLRQAWTATEPFDFDGEHYHAYGFRSRVLPLQQAGIEISFAGNSPAALLVGAALADNYALYTRPLAEQAKDIAAIRALAAESGRSGPLRFTMIARPVLGRTDALAWARAERIKRRAQEVAQQDNPSRSHIARPGTEGQPSEGDVQLANLNDSGERHDTALWTAVAGISHRANSAALVGSPETVAGALLAYYDLGIDRFIIHGFDSYEDVAAYGRDLIPLVRQEAEILRAGVTLPAGA